MQVPPLSDPSKTVVSLAKYRTSGPTGDPSAMAGKSFIELPTRNCLASFPLNDT